MAFILSLHGGLIVVILWGVLVNVYRIDSTFSMAFCSPLL
jgi:hypothetical protein